MRQFFYVLTAYCLRAGRCKRAVMSFFYAALLLAGSAAQPVEAEKTLILAFGDSLTAGYELAQSESFPAQLERYLRDEEGMAVRVINGGVSGDTTTGGLNRLDWVLAGAPRTPDLVILELGANDALRGIDPELTRKNLDAILDELRERGIRVLLTGMKAPPNMGEDYAAAFNAIFPELADKHDVAFYPFFLKGVAAKESLNLDDGMHPNAKGVHKIVKKIAPHVCRVLDRKPPQAADAAAGERESGS